jgi:hypothetical protein
MFQLESFPGINIFELILENCLSQIRVQTIASVSEPANTAYSLFRILFGHLLIVESRYQHLSKFGTPLYLVATQSVISNQGHNSKSMTFHVVFQSFT